jgi:hypothetical protein
MRSTTTCHDEDKLSSVISTGALRLASAINCSRAALFLSFNPLNVMPIDPVEGFDGATGTEGFSIT